MKLKYGDPIIKGSAAQKQRLNFRVINSSLTDMRNDVVETLRYERDLINQYCDNMQSYWDQVK